LEEDISSYFDFEGKSPYMLLVMPVAQSKRKHLPEDFSQLNWKEKLYYHRSDIPAITHVDFSARLQTVNRETNPKYHLLLEIFKQQTGCPLLVNTSFNVRGEPIVCSAGDAYHCFMTTGMDFLVIGNYLFDKKNPTSMESNFTRSKYFWE
jgi:carbamoyltransferase